MNVKKKILVDIAVLLFRGSFNFKENYPPVRLGPQWNECLQQVVFPSNQKLVKLLKTVEPMFTSEEQKIFKYFYKYCESWEQAHMFYLLGNTAPYSGYSPMGNFPGELDDIINSKLDVEFPLIKNKEGR